MFVKHVIQHSFNIKFTKRQRLNVKKYNIKQINKKKQKKRGRPNR